MFSIPNIPLNYRIKIHGRISKIYLTLIREIIGITLYKERIKNPKLEIEVIICDEKKMQDHNKEYLKKEGPTDIISIAYEKEPTNESVTLLGTILICPKVIKENSDELKKEYIKHMSHLLIHGTLHLLGYNHEDEEDQKQMEMKEVNILSFLGIESPYL